MRIRGLIEEDFSNYKSPSMFLGTCFCDFKCCNEAGIPTTVCQNKETENNVMKHIPDNILLSRYRENPLIHAIVIGGLEPFLQFDEILEFVKYFRTSGVEDPIIIYTGYNREEIESKVFLLSVFKNIIIKFGRYKPGLSTRYDPLLGVTLASENQYAELISIQWKGDKNEGTH